jgi:hypothetical protein
MYVQGDSALMLAIFQFDENMLLESKDTTFDVRKKITRSTAVVVSKTTKLTSLHFLFLKTTTAVERVIFFLTSKVVSLDSNNMFSSN